MSSQLPAGPRLPAPIQLLGFWTRPLAFLERCRARYGPRFTLRLPGVPPFVVLSDPDEIREVFQAPPEVLHPGEGARILEPLVGSNSVILLDEKPHLEQRRLMLPAFHGERVTSMRGLMEELTERELDSWPCDEVVALHPRLQNLTLEIVLRTVFGLERGARLDALRGLLTEILRYSETPLSIMPIPAWMRRPPFAGRGPVGRLDRLLAQADELIYGLIDERRREDADGDGDGVDVLAMLLAARHEDDSPMSPAELRDELVTALVAGHETTASQLAWTFNLLAAEPRVLARVVEEVDAGEDDEYLTATTNEAMRRRAVIPNAEPRLVKQPIEIGGVRYEPGVVLVANAHLVHHDAAIYPDPYAFRPERFLERAPGTYTWLPFGGGRRRCLGASFAQLEMKVVLRAVLRRFELEAAPGGVERARRRAITISPADGGRVVLRRRTLDPAAAEPPALAA